MNCLICNNKIVGQGNKFCSKHCYYIYKSKNKFGGKPKSRKNIKCLYCKKNFEVITSSKRKYCSKLCSGKSRIGKQHSFETIKKISLSNKGKHCSIEDIKRNQTNAKLGGLAISKKRSGKTYEEIYGKERAKQLRNKLSNVHKGTVSEKKGLTFEEYYGTDEAKRIKKQIRTSVLKDFKTPIKAFKKGCVPWNKGKTMEELYGKEEAKRRKLEWKTNVRDKIVLPLKDSKPELKMQSILDSLGIKYKKHKFINNIEHKYQCDIFIEPNIVIEVDGVYWHKYPHGRDIDEARTKEMIEKGYTVFRYWEGKFNLEKIKNEVGYILGVENH